MARTGMTDLINELRGLTEASVNEYSILGSNGVTTYWDDDQMQNVMDLHRMDVIFEQLESYPTQIAGGSISYQDYRSAFGHYEATTGGSAIFYIQDSTGSTIGTSTYTPDYRRGVVLFSADQAGTSYYLTGRSYDMNAAAADVWRRKAAHYAPTAVDFSTDGHNISRSQIYAHCLEMAEFFEGKGANAIDTIEMMRGDLESW